MIHRRISTCRDGGAAIEFALVAPVFILILLTAVAYGIYLATAHGVQQIAADSARVAIAGLDANERIVLARDYIESAALDYPFIDNDKLEVDVHDDAVPGQFTVNLAYDSSDLPIWNLFTFAMPDPRIERHSTIRVGGI